MGEPIQGPKETVTISYVIRLHLPEIQQTQVKAGVLSPQLRNSHEKLRF